MNERKVSLDSTMQPAKSKKHNKKNCTVFTTNSQPKGRDPSGQAAWSPWQPHSLSRSQAAKKHIEKANTSQVTKSGKQNVVFYV